MAQVKVTGSVIAEFAEKTIKDQTPMHRAYQAAQRRYDTTPFYEKWITPPPRPWDYRYDNHADNLATDILKTIESCGPQVEFLLNEHELECLGVTV